MPRKMHAARLGLVAVLAIAAATFIVTTPGSPVANANNEPGSEAVRREATFDDMLVRVTEKVPGFGGLFVDEETNTLYVYSWNQTSYGAAEAGEALTAVFGNTLPKGRLKVILGLYSFRELKRWHDHMGDVLRIPGVVMTDIDDAKNRLTVGVETEEVGWAVEDRLAELGIPREAVNIEQTLPVTPEVSLRDRHRPLAGGLEIRFTGGGSTFLCTFGFNAVRAGVSGFVTNSHCSATQGRVEGTTYHQATISGTDNRVAYERVDPTYFTGSPCPTGRRCRRSDSAFAYRYTGVTASQGRIARTALNSVAWNGTDTFRIVREADPVVGQTVTKVGRTTGRTQGSVTLVCATFNVAPPSTITHLCQSRASYSSAGGDSGSPVFLITNSPAANDVSLSGIHWGSGGVFSPISGIQRSAGPAELGPLNTCALGFGC